MGNWKKTYKAVMSGDSDANIPFGDCSVMLQRYGFKAHQSGSHLIFSKPGCEMINIQNRDGKIKPYQVRQIRDILKNEPEL